VLLGIAMIVLPGPAFIVIPIGLAILGAEFAWAQRWLRLVEAKLQSVLNIRGHRIKEKNKGDGFFGRCETPLDGEEGNVIGELCVTRLAVLCRMVCGERCMRCSWR